MLPASGLGGVTYLLSRPVRRLLDVSRLWVAFATTAGLCSLTFFVALAASLRELGGGAPAWLTAIGFALIGISGLAILWTSALVVKWLVLKLGRR